MSTIDDRRLADLLALERSHDDMPPDAEARMLTAIESAIGGGDGGGDDGGGSDGGGSAGAGGSGGASGSAGAGGGAVAGGAAAGTGASAVGAATSAMSWLARAAYLGAGVVAGATGHAVVADKPAPVAITAPSPVASSIAARTSAPPSIASAAPTPSAVAIDDLPSARLPSPAPRPIASARPADDTRIGEERAALDVARAALARGRVETCLDAIERHVRTYGEGHFAEEREVLAVQALVAANRREEALARAARFRAKYPNSLFLSAIAKATEKKEPSP